jgi:hypothetical protein
LNPSSTDNTTGPDAARDSAGAPPRQGRRLSDKVLIAFHHACDIGDFETADDLLRILGRIIAQQVSPPEANRRRSLESLVAAHERLWHLRHPDAA